MKDNFPAYGERRVPLPPPRQMPHDELSPAGAAAAAGATATMAPATATGTATASGSAATTAPGSATDRQSAPAAGTSAAGPRSHAKRRGTGRDGKAAAADAKAKPRDAFFDNAKYLAIVLVAMGHSWEPLRDGSRTAAALYITVYAFHMPAFIIISGYFSRSFDMRKDRLQRLITGVAVPYILFEVAYTLFKRWADDDPGYPISLMDPWYLTWFLAALFIWRLTTPLWKIVRWPVPLALSIAVLASLSPDIGDDLDLQRVLQFLPFFVIGLSLRPEHFKLVRRRKARILAVPVFAAALVFAYWAAPRMNAAWFYHRDAAQELAAPWWSGAVMTLAMFGCSLVLVACFFAWIPGRTMWCTALGAGTLYGYLLHGFLAKGSRFWNWYDADWMQTPWGAVLLTLIAGTVITLLCTPPVQRIFRFAMEPKMTWAFKKDPVGMARGRN
ncbi:Fucose 4-O-acetylase [Streptomyces sp. 2224.1]|nr:fucose 4-O-acetylase-like acetyltransferase [Streptomyces sp. 2321.6]SDR35409.1 Fucose 4-O-acetylase [Streptomyces sp. KS_16]SEB84038.1 Fucose 4-O-acetylase [Streptomyces sp. 2224.1]SED18757.1 Fucose 4-O-acetylase [Streptomyces sp. 2133.1]SEE62569.1 Fucose 4-O-acetylase [Streptomyces sp. 2112.3]SNC70149.1 Fucose 4-O-acetylase [Streptomyces sp. 2114.4]